MKVKTATRTFLSGNFYFFWQVSSAVIEEKHRTFFFDLNALKSLENIPAIEFIRSSIPLFPLNLRETFPSLTVLSIYGCGLESISRSDLNGLGELVELYLKDNKLVSLPNDLLIGMTKLKWIDLSNNKIEFLNSRVFAKIKNLLDGLDLLGNTKIDGRYLRSTPGSSIDSLFNLIDSQCLSNQPNLSVQNFTEKFTEGFQSLWLTGRFSDFTIVVANSVEQKEFKVHKNVLGTQSEVFAAMFEIDLEERRTSQMTISDFSSAAIDDFLSFLYFGKLRSVENAVEVFVLAAKYNVADLKSIAEEAILFNIEEEICLEVLELANLHGSEVLMNQAFDYIQLAFPDIKFDKTLMHRPEAIKKRIKAKQEYDLIVKEAKKKMEAVFESTD